MGMFPTHSTRFLLVDGIKRNSPVISGVFMQVLCRPTQDCAGKFAYVNTNGKTRRVSFLGNIVRGMKIRAPNDSYGQITAIGNKQTGVVGFKIYNKNTKKTRWFLRENAPYDLEIVDAIMPTTLLQERFEF